MSVHIQGRVAVDDDLCVPGVGAAHLVYSCTAGKPARLYSLQYNTVQSRGVSNDW